MDKKFAIIEIGSNNTKTHIYENTSLVSENNITIEFKKNYKKENKIQDSDLEKLLDIIKSTLKYTENVHIYGCSIFRNITQEELSEINKKIQEKFHLQIEVVSQEDEAKYTALGCYNNIKYDGDLCIFIGGGGSIELIFVRNRNIIEKRFYNFGVVDITNQFNSLKEDVPTCAFEEVSNYIDGCMENLNIKAPVLILAGGDHLYWYNHAKYDLLANTLYESENQKYMITREMSDHYDRDSFVTSLNKIREASDNPLWFDGSRAMKVITNLISHKVNAQYIIPTKINMEDGLKEMLIS